MIILHTCWHGGGLCVWGESDVGGAQEMRAETKQPYEASPFDAGREALAEAVNAVMRGVEAPPIESFDLAIDLPTRLDERNGTRPVPSFAFPDGSVGYDDAGEAVCVTLRPWRVSALRLPSRATLTLLSLCRERRLGPEIFAGEDALRYAELLRYAGALVARGRYLPDIKRITAGFYEARWRPCIDREETRRLERLAKRLPACAVCGETRRAAAEAFLSECVDGLVRLSVMTTLSRAQAERGRHYSAHDAWFSALRGETRRIRWDRENELDALAGQLDVWRRAVEGGRTRDEQVALHLNEPDEPSQPWRLSVSFPRPGCEPTEDMLISLGQAILLFPPLGAADDMPEGPVCALSSLEAHAFLTESSALLAASGFDVRLPLWWRPDGMQTLTLEAEAAPQHRAEETPSHALDERVDVRWRVTLNGSPVSRQELESLLDADSPLVFFRGQWIHLDVRQIQSALRIARSQTPDKRSALDVVRFALGTGGNHCGLDVSAVRGESWLHTVLNGLNDEQSFEALPQPAGFRGELRPYQQRGFSWLVRLRAWGFGACLADDMGLGKTIQALAFLLHQREQGERRPALLIGPTSVLGNWLKEASRFAPELRCKLHHGPARSHGSTFTREACEADLVITSYNLLFRDYTDLRKVAWAGILLDEAQNIKNPDTQQAQVARALQADYRIALTGTPLENHVGDIWSIMDFLNPGMLGRRATFRNAFFRPIQAGTDPGARARLRRVTAPFILRRLKTDKQIIADLPEKIENKVYCPLTPEQASLYEEVLDAFQRDIENTDGIERRGRILGVITRLKQICNHPAHYLGQVQAAARRSGKLTRLEEMLEEVFARGESALVFTQYAAMGALLKRRLCQAFACDMPFLHGGVPRKEREHLVQSYQESGRPLAFILSLKAGGTGLNLTRASHVFHYDRWWNPAVENQATDRAFRIGQTHTVMVHKFICGGTLEERIDAMINSKTALAGEIVTNGEAFLTEMTNEELRDILRLSEATVAYE